MNKFASRKLGVLLLNYAVTILMLKFGLITSDQWMTFLTITTTAYMGTNTISKFAKKDES